MGKENEKDDIRYEIENLKRDVYNINCRIANLERQLNSNKNISERPVLRTKNQPNILTKKEEIRPLDKPIKDRSENKDIENSLGKNIMVILASILVFIGLSSLIMLLFDNITDIMKLALIYIFTLGFSSYGLYLVNKNRNTFTLGLSSCGLGSVYISILVTYFVYDYINEILLFILLMSWSCFIIFMNNKLKSDVYLFISNIGILLALFLGFNYDLSIYLYLILFVSYFLSGYYFCIYSKIKNIYLKYYLDIIYLISLPFILDNYVYSDLNNMFISISYIIIIPVFIYLIYNNFCNYIKDSDINLKNILVFILSFLSLLLTNILTLFNLCESEIFKFLNNYDYIGYAILGYLILFVSIYLYNQLFTKLNSNLNIILYFILFIVNCTLLDELNEYIIYVYSIVLLILPLLGTGWGKKDKLYLDLSLFTFTISNYYIYDYTYKLVRENLNSQYFIIGLFIFAIINFIFVCYKEKNKEFNLSTISYLSFLSSFYMILNLVFYNNDKYIIIMMMLLSIYVLIIPKLYKDNLSNKNILLLLNKLINGFLLFASLNEMYSNDEMHVVLLFIASIITVLQAVVYIVKLIKERTKYSGFYVGIKTTAYILIMLNIYLKSFTNISYVYSVVLILLAILFILYGFKYDYKEFRLYGLILSFIGVFKLVLIDINYEASILRVCSFLFAGMLCFIISYIYNKMDEKMKN